MIWLVINSYCLMFFAWRSLLGTLCLTLLLLLFFLIWHYCSSCYSLFDATTLLVIHCLFNVATPLVALCLMLLLFLLFLAQRYCSLLAWRYCFFHYSLLAWHYYSLYYCLFEVTTPLFTPCLTMLLLLLLFACCLFSQCCSSFCCYSFLYRT